MNVDEHLLNVVNMLTKDENMPEANSNEDNEITDGMFTSFNGVNGRKRDLEKGIWKSSTKVGRTAGNPACGWERATSRTNTLSEQMME